MEDEGDSFVQGDDFVSFGEATRGAFEDHMEGALDPIFQTLRA